MTFAAHFQFEICISDHTAATLQSYIYQGEYVYISLILNIKVPTVYGVEKLNLKDQEL